MYPQKCHILAEWLCGLISKDLFTCIIALWIGLQVTWVTMLVIVQSVQIAKGMTTYEAMHGHQQYESDVPRAITAALTTGSVMTDEPRLAQGNISDTHNHSHARKKDFWTQWKKLLGLDTFMATARSGLKRSSPRRRQNPFSLGLARNCTDFWCDPAPIFGKRETGVSMLDGAPVNYASLFETPRNSVILETNQSSYEGVAVEAV